MVVKKQYASDVDLILTHKHDNGADLWTTPDKRLIKGAVQIPYNKPLPLDLIKDIAKWCYETENHH